METRDKLIGVALIIIGIVFITLGVMFSMQKATTNPKIYMEQNDLSNENNQTNMIKDNVNNSIYQETVDVYSEVTDEGTTRYIY